MEMRDTARILICVLGLVTVMLTGSNRAPMRKCA